MGRGRDGRRWAIGGSVSRKLTRIVQPPRPRHPTAYRLPHSEKPRRHSRVHYPARPRLPGLPVSSSLGRWPVRALALARALILSSTLATVQQTHRIGACTPPRLWPVREKRFDLLQVKAATHYLGDGDPLFASDAVRTLARIDGESAKATLTAALATESRGTVQAAMPEALAPTRYGEWWRGGGRMA